jgi:hypothetical protein
MSLHDLPLRPTRHFWTVRDIAILRERYADGGAVAIAREIGRPVGSVYQKARSLGLKTPAGASPYKSWPNTERIDEAIRLAHQRPIEKGGIAMLAAELDRPRWWVSRRARELGLKTPRFKEPPWSEEEIELLHETAHMALGAARRRFVSAGFARSDTAIMVQRKRHEARPGDNGMRTALQVARLLGVDNKTVTRWIGIGELNAKKRGSDRTTDQGGDHWWIADRSLRAFIAANPLRVELRKIPDSSRTWFIELLTGRAA